MNEKAMFDHFASRFMAVYRKKIIDKYRTVSDLQRLQTLLQTNDFARSIYGMSQNLCTKYDSDAWQASVLDTIDLDTIYTNVEAVEGTPEDYVDRLVKELLRYFKKDFFRWCNKPDCRHCSSPGEQMTPVGHQPPNDEERPYDCGVVEVYQCSNCKHLTRFPRFNHPVKLLETRSGRCGEWCNLFMLLLKSFGIEARYIWNREDHVWCEFYSTNLKRWVHVDSCEQSFDEPHIYSVNWNKKMSYAIAFNNTGVVDVSKRYIIQNQLTRDQISEQDLVYLLETVTKRLRAGLGDHDLYKLACRDEQEKLGWATVSDDSTPTKTGSSLKGRESGSADWKNQRGEDGT
ncbi:LADA_0D03862g1_1 [Lachancea dasiensis]|uniref:Peptide-N(4)-(N-acetyl-beta-glucosaminyl)asparagine amidase n=1 Tax=Lachancea dasiensis TaxID=1072105 RepID=A0A1G4J5J7_9SACH|nr:LADA_0D03862g1_1 [Lachancea dasiensis]